MENGDYKIVSGLGRMKVLVANKFFYSKGGSERVFFQEREFLKSQGIEVVDFSMHDKKNLPSMYSDYFIKNINYYDKRKLASRLLNGINFIHCAEAVRNIKRIINVEKPDIAHLHNIYHQLTPAIIKKLKKHDIKVLLTLHDSKLICPSYLMLDQGKICTVCEGKKFWKLITRSCQDSMLNKLLLMIEAYWHKWARSYERVDRFLVPSRFLVELISQRIPKEKISILPNGVDVNEYSPHFNHQGYALYFGRISKEKGIETLLKAYRLFNGKKKLKVAGTGPLLKELQERYEYSDVEFMGYKHGSALKKIIANASFVIVPSELYENCSMVVLEAMAMGKPVIGAKIGGIPEQIEDNKTGLLFEPGSVRDLRDKMALLWDNEELGVMMGKAAREKLEKEFSLNYHFAQLLAIYEELLSMS